MKELNEEGMKSLLDHELIGEIRDWATETRNLVKGFTHSKDCSTKADSCPQLCCESQLTEMSAVIWTTHKLFKDLRTFANVSENRSTLSNLLYLTRTHEILYQITQFFEFTTLANTHRFTTGQEHYFTKYWFWDEVKLIKVKAADHQVALRNLVNSVLGVHFL